MKSIITNLHVVVTAYTRWPQDELTLYLEKTQWHRRHATDGPFFLLIPNKPSS